MGANILDKFLNPVYVDGFGAGFGVALFLLSLVVGGLHVYANWNGSTPGSSGPPCPRPQPRPRTGPPWVEMTPVPPIIMKPIERLSPSPTGHAIGPIFVKPPTFREGT